MIYSRGSEVLFAITEHELEVDYYTADVVAYNDQYPYGMLMPGRNESSSDYRYGFQGQEMDDEVKGKGNSINYKYRMHDPRIGRFFAVDPLTAKYPHYSPYSFSGNKVIAWVELEGLEESQEPASAGAHKLVPLLYVVTDEAVLSVVMETATATTTTFVSTAFATVFAIFIPTSTGSGADAVPKQVLPVDLFSFGPPMDPSEVEELIGLNERVLDLNAMERGRYTILKRKMDAADGRTTDENNSERRLIATDVNKARILAQEITGLGAGAEYWKGSMNHNRGEKIGLISPDGTNGYRYDIDKDGKFHINIEQTFDFNGISYEINTRIDIPGGKEAYDAKMKELQK